MAQTARIAAAALRYLGIVFPLAFAFGAFRVMWLTPRTGAALAVLIELPVILAVSWVAARALHRRWPWRSGGEALAVGLTAFAGLLALECLLAVAVFGQSAASWAATLVTPMGLLGLAGQVLFGLFPWWVVRRATASQR